LSKIAPMSIAVCRISIVVDRGVHMPITPILRSIACSLSLPAMPNDPRGMTSPNRALGPARSPEMITSRRCRGSTAILDAMCDLLQHKTLAQISMGEIAKRAGVSRRTLHSHFQGAPQLFELMCREVFMQLAPLVPLSVSQAMPLDLALTKYCRQASRLFTDTRHRQLQRILMREESPWLLNAYDRHVGGPMLAALTDYLGQRWPAAPTAEIADLTAQLLSMLNAAYVAPPPFHRVCPTAWPDVVEDILIRTILTHSNELTRFAA